MNSDQIFGIIMIVIIIGSCIYHSNYTNKTNQELNQKMSENPKQKEKIKVIKSLSQPLAENSKNSKSSLFILIAIFFLILIILLVLDKKNIDYENIKKISLSIGICLFIFSLVLVMIKQKKFKNYIKKLLIQKYVDIKEDKKFQSLVIDQKNNFCFKILKYKCIVNNYTEKRLVNQNYLLNERRHKKIKKVKNVFEYYYNLKVLGIKKPTSDLLLEDTINDSIKELSKRKLIDVKIIDDYLFISKITVLHGYNKEDAIIDISDVELFYEQIVKKILENNYIKN